MPTLQRQGPASYSCPEPAAIGAWLVEQGYTTELSRSGHEYLRFRRGKSLLVVYHNGTVLLQGADTTTPRQLLDTLLDDAPAALPF